MKNGDHSSPESIKKYSLLKTLAEEWYIGTLE
jgi:hypothetical protein